MTVKKTITKKNDNTNKKFMDVVSNLNAETVIEQIGELQLNLQATLAGLGAAVTSKVEQMQNVEKAIELKQNELKDLYSIEKEALCLEEIKKKREEEEADFEKNREKRDAEWLEEETIRNKKWAREEEEHEYSANQRMKRSEEDYKNLVNRNKHDEAARQEALAKSWQERETKLSEKEQEFESLKNKVILLEEQMKKEVKQAEAITENRMKKHYEHEIALIMKDAESERLLHQTKVSALDDNIRGLEDRIDKIQKELVAAREDVKEVTQAALSSASGREVASALSTFATSSQTNNLKK